MAAATLSLTFPEPDIALLTFDTPGKAANVLSAAVLDELEEHLGVLELRSDLAGLILISGKPQTFIAGADLREFAAALPTITEDQTYAMCRRGQQLFARLSRAPFVTVAAIDGICVGGGAELASWCDRRIMTADGKTELGFPEVKLGLFPGWGGTARAPRIVGLGNAVEMITGGESLRPGDAAAMGWGELTSRDRLLPSALKLVRVEQQTKRYLRDREQWSRPLELSDTELGFLGVTASAVIRQQTKGQYPAPEAALNLMLEAALVDLEQACELEARQMAPLFGSPVNAALLNVFFLTDRNKKDRGVDREDVTARELASAGVIGAGIMGAGIAAANLKRHTPVVLSDASEEAVRKGAEQALSEAAYDRALKGPSASRATQLAPLLNLGLGDAELARCDVVIEAIVENAEIKQKLLQRIEPLLGPDAILASNTSTIPISRLAEGLARPEQFCGIHFFNPVRRMKLVEVIRGEQTSDETVATAVRYAKHLGKMPIVVKDGAGFLVNRLLFPYMNEAVELLCEGAPLKEIERAATAFGMPMGPIALFDMVGLDTAVLAGRTMWEAYPSRVNPLPLLPALVKAERYGRKSGRGFYSYENRKGRAEPDPAFEQILAPYIRKPKSFDREQITHRLFAPMLLEATRVLEEQLVRDPRDIDLGLVFGIGFPPFKGGLLFWADTLGAPQLLKMIEPFEELGARFHPTDLLRTMAREGTRFYPT